MAAWHNKIRMNPVCSLIFSGAASFLSLPTLVLRVDWPVGSHHTESACRFGSANRRHLVFESPITINRTAAADMKAYKKEEVAPFEATSV